MSTPTSYPGGSSAQVSASVWLRVFERAVTYLANTAFAGAILLVLMDLLLLGASVAARYLLNSPLLWSDPIVALSLTGITMLAAPKVLLERGHIEVDIISAMVKGRLSLVIQLWSSVSVFAVALLLIFNGWSTAMFSKMIGLLTDGYLELPLWPLQLLLPLGGALLVPVVILHVWKTALVWRQHAPSAEHRSALVD